MSDDEYIPQSHPLYKILNESGLNEDLIEPLMKSDPLQVKEQSLHIRSSLIFDCIKSSIQKCHNYFQSVEFTFIIEVLNLLQSSSLLTEEDYPLVSYQKDTLLGQVESKQTLKIPLTILWLFDYIHHIRYSLCTILCILVAYQLSTYRIPWCILTVILVLSFTVIVGSVFSKGIRDAKLLIHPLTTLVAKLNDYNRISRRSILFVQETEVIARGFTFVNKNSLGSRLETLRTKQSGRQIPRFRRNLFLEIRKYIFLVRCMVQELIKNYPSVRQFDSVKCLVDIPPTEFGPCLTISESDEDELLEKTQEFAIPLLKAMHEFSQSHVSELIREISLVLTLNQRDESLQVLNSLLSGWIRISDCATNTLSHMYSVQRACSAPVMPQPTTSHSDQPSDSSKNLYSAVHSLSLHLQSVLYKIRNLEDKMESTCEDSSSDHSLQFNKESIHGTLTGLESEFNACHVCWEEALKLSLSDRKQSDETSPDVTHKLQKNANAEERQQKVPTRWALSEPIIEDEFLEAFVESDVEQDDACENLDDLRLTAAQGREKLRAEKQQAKKMLGELHSVISVRAKDWKKREKRAKRRKEGLNEDADVSSCDSESQFNDNSPPNSQQTQEKSPVSPGETVELTDNEKSQVKRRLAELPNSFQLGLASTVANQVLLKRQEMAGMFPNFTTNREETFIESSDQSD